MVVLGSEKYLLKPVYSMMSQIIWGVLNYNKEEVFKITNINKRSLLLSRIIRKVTIRLGIDSIRTRDRFRSGWRSLVFGLCSNSRRSYLRFYSCKCLVHASFLSWTSRNKHISSVPTRDLGHVWLPHQGIPIASLRDTSCHQSARSCRCSWLWAWCNWCTSWWLDFRKGSLTIKIFVWLFRRVPICLVLWRSVFLQKV